MNISWYYNRLRSMSAPEISARVVEYAKKRRDKRLKMEWGKFSASCDVELPRLHGFMQAIDSARDLIYEDALCAAKEIMEGRFAALGVAWPPIDFSCDENNIWHLDPVTRRSWPADKYCFDIRYRNNNSMGDVKYVWELSRLQFLQPIAIYGHLSGDAGAVDFIEGAITTWYKSNPPFSGVGWSSGIELSLRVISLMVVTSLLGPELSERVRTYIAQIICSHAYWLKRYPSGFSSANNHLVAEEAALYLIGATCSFVPGAKRMRAHAESALVREAQLQILPDGVAAEQSPTYGALTSEMFLLCAFVAEHSESPLPAVISERLASFSEWVQWLAEADGGVPSIGDDDEGRVLTLGREPNYAASVAAAVAAFARRSDLVPPHTPTLRNVLAGPAAPAPMPIGTRTFCTGGYTVHRTVLSRHTVTLVIDHAPLGYLAIAAHGHADALAFTMAVNGKPMFVDPGTYLYHSGHEWRSWFRNTRAHNSVSVEGAEQSIISGPFNWSHKACSFLTEVECSPFTLEAWHDGYKGRFNVRHVRRYELVENELTLRDALVGGAARQAEIVLQLSPECETVVDDDVIIILRNGERLACISFPRKGIWTQTRGQNRPDGGWVSPRFGVKVPATRLSWRGIIGNDGVTTRITLV